jgi:hypothetical protein
MIDLHIYLFIGLAPFQLERNARVPLAAEPLPLMIPFLADHRAMDFTVSKICELRPRIRCTFQQ